MDKKATRLSKAARNFNVGISTIVDFLHKKGIDIDSNPNTKIDPEIYDMLASEYSSDLSIKKKSKEFSLLHFKDKENKQGDVTITDSKETKETITQKQEEEVFIKDSSTSPPVTEIKEKEKEKKKE